MNTHINDIIRRSYLYFFGIALMSMSAFVVYTCNTTIIPQIAVQVFALVVMFAIKHFVADGPLQTSFQYMNKGKFGHIGGIIHSGIQALFTFAGITIWDKIFSIGLFPDIIISAMLFDFVIHYMCDLMKVKITHRCGWSKTVYNDNGSPSGLLITSNTYFIALLADQLVHALTYAIIILYMVSAMTTG